MNKRMKCLFGCGLLIAALAGCGKTEEMQNTKEQEENLQESQQSQQEEMQAEQQDLESQDGQQAQEPSESQQPEEMQPDGEVQGNADFSLRVWGPVLSVEEGTVVIDNRSDLSFRGEMILSIEEEGTRILDAENGYPVELSELSEEEAVFAYIGSTAALSEPPMVSASLILCEIPDDLRIPDYVHVVAMEEQPDGSYLLTGDNEIQYLVPQECETLPYLTRNVVTLQDIQEGKECLIWSDEKRTAQKIVLFAD